MRTRLIPLVIGATLALVGVFLLLRNLGILPAGFDLWPVLLIAVGVVVLLAGRQQHQAGEVSQESAAASLDGAAEARLVLKHGAGVLQVRGGAASGFLFEGAFTGGVRQEIHRSGERMEATLRQPSDPERWIRQHGGLGWTVALTGEVPVELEVQAGASRTRLDLEEVALRGLRVQTGASEMDIRLARRGRYRVHVSAGAAEVRVHVPTGLAASIVTRSALAGVSIDRTRFPAAGGGFRSPDYDAAEDRVDIELEGGVASFSVD
jgi:hypothetical protein